ncbi:MAG: hypothetical protein ACRYGK_01470 [Janthinobacterium lividum]
MKTATTSDTATARTHQSRIHLLRAALVLASTALALFASNHAGAATAAGSAISNQALATYVDSASTSRSVTSNTVMTTVQQVGALTIAANGAKNVGPGQVASYPHTITNTGNGTDTFTLSASNTGGFGYPAVQFFVDANGDGIADNATPITSTDAIAPGATFKFVEVATVPAATAAGATNTITVTATSQFTPSSSATNTDTTTVSSVSTVDITSNSAGSNAPGAGPGPEATAVTTNTVNPGSTTRFTMYLNNPGNASDSFLLAASTDGSFGTTTLPSGWTVVFKDAGGSIITSASVGAGSNAVVYADVTVPGGAGTAVTDLYFRALGNTSGSSDRMHDAVNVVPAQVQTAIVITQALDSDCDGIPNGAYQQTPITTGAVPGACIRYRITTTNISSTTVTSVVVYNNVPLFSVYAAAPHPAITSAGTFTQTPADGSAGNFIVNVGTMTAGQVNVVEYGVKIVQ